MNDFIFKFIVGICNVLKGKKLIFMRNVRWYKKGDRVLKSDVRNVFNYGNFWGYIVYGVELMIKDFIKL